LILPDFRYQAGCLKPNIGESLDGVFTGSSIKPAILAAIKLNDHRRAKANASQKKAASRESAPGPQAEIRRARHCQSATRLSTY
jgi:hypothetical protein